MLHLRVKWKKNEETEKMWSNFIKPGLKKASPNTSPAVAAKTKNPQMIQTTTNSLKSISGGEILRLTDKHGIGFRLKLIFFCFR